MIVVVFNDIFYNCRHTENGLIVTSVVTCVAVSVLSQLLSRRLHNTNMMISLSCICVSNKSRFAWDTNKSMHDANVFVIRCSPRFTDHSCWPSAPADPFISRFSSRSSLYRTDVTFSFPDINQTSARRVFGLTVSITSSVIVMRLGA